LCLKGELAIQNRLCLNFAEKDVAEQEMAIGGVWMALEVFTDKAVGFGEL
jgi:hypothetical protein